MITPHLSCVVCGCEKFVEFPVVSLKNKDPKTNQLTFSNLERQSISSHYSCHQCGNPLKEGVIDKLFFDIYRVNTVVDKVRLAKSIQSHLGENIYFILKNKKESFLFQAYIDTLDDRYSFVRERDIEITCKTVFCTALKSGDFYEDTKNYVVCLTEKEFEKKGLTESEFMDAFQDRFNVRFRSY